MGEPEPAHVYILHMKKLTIILFILLFICGCSSSNNEGIVESKNNTTISTDKPEEAKADWVVTHTSLQSEYYLAKVCNDSIYVQNMNIILKLQTSSRKKPLHFSKIKKP